MLTFKRFSSANRSAQRRNRTADTGIFNRLQPFENTERSAPNDHPRGLYVGGLGKTGVPSSPLGRSFRESVPPVTRRPEWLSVAREHLRQHHPGEGLAESCLWALRDAGFDPMAESRSNFPPPLDSDEDVMAGLRKVVCP